MRIGPSCASPEQGIGSGAVRGGLVTVGRHAANLGGEKRDPRVQLCLRIGTEIFAREATRRVSDGAWAIGFFHLAATSAPSALLSIGETVIRGPCLVNGPYRGNL